MKSPSKSMVPLTSIPVVFNDEPSASFSSSMREFSKSVGPGMGLVSLSTLGRKTISHDERPSTSGSSGLREVDANINAGGSLVTSPILGSVTEGVEEVVQVEKVLKKSVGKLPVLRSGKKSAAAGLVVVPEGRENVNVLSSSGAATGRRRSPRTH